ncbi:LysR substrate-binding domain-containing protein, partial [Rhizobium ruizarguesonis]
MLLAKLIAAVRRDHPGVEITLVGEKRLASLNRREADIAVRMSRPEDGDYAIVKLGETSFHLYASKTYLETVSPSDWTFIGYDETMNASPQQLRLIELAAGRPIAVRSSVLEFQAATARLGAGVVMLPDFAVLESSGLQRIETEQPLTREVWLVVHSDIKDVPSVRVVTDALIALQGALGDADGIVGAFGTGSVYNARRDGRLNGIGGWGFVVGDQASG